MTARAPTVLGASSRSRGRYGWVVLAAVMMMLLGAFHAVAGLVAVLGDDVHTARGLV